MINPEFPIGTTFSNDYEIEDEDGHRSSYYGELTVGGYVYYDNFIMYACTDEEGRYVEVGSGAIEDDDDTYWD